MPTALAHNLKRHRESRGWSQRHLGDLCGCTGVAVHMWENGHRTPRPRYLARLNAVLQVNLDLN